VIRLLTLVAISVGGGLGALARWLLGEVFPAGRTAFPWTTLAINVSGCLLIGVLMVLVSDVWVGRRLLRPFLGVGVLGGYTTFSTYTVDITRLVSNGAATVGLAYLVGTVCAALVATYAGIAGTRLLVERKPR
jgi:fluoride exporter